MATIIVLFNLRPGVSPVTYEQWARTTDLPVVNALSSVERFEVLKSTGVLGGGEAPYQYVEILRFSSLDDLFNDIGSETMKRVASEFQTFADGPLFITTESL
jgi:hypothetical protein